MSFTSRVDQMSQEDQELSYAVSVLAPLLHSDSKREFSHLITDPAHETVLSERIKNWKDEYHEGA